MRRPRVLVALLTLFLLLTSFLPAAGANEYALSSQGLPKVGVKIDDRLMDFTGYIVNGRTVVPLRAIFEALGSEIKWNPDTYTVTATKGAKIVILTVGKVGAYVDGKPVSLAVPPVLIDSRTFVPLRFIAEALGAEVKWDGNTYTAMINTGSDCTLSPFQKHEGTIAPGGETWGKCGSPHIVSGAFRVEGTDSPILTIEPGAVVRFEAGASIQVGQWAPGGFVVNGTTTDRALFTADSSGPQPGFWNGIHFYNQTLINDTRIRGAKFDYAGNEEHGALTVHGEEKMVEIQLNDVEIANSLYAGLHLVGQGRLRAGSSGLKINKTASAGEAGGFPIVTDALGSHNLPSGEFKGNAVNAVHLATYSGSDLAISANTTWRNLGIPYAVTPNVWVEGKASPTLTIEPGAIMLFATDANLYIGRFNPGTLIADGRGGGEWKTILATNEDLEKLASVSSLEPGCALCGSNKAIIFGAWTANPDRGAWPGITFGPQAGSKNVLNGAVVAYGRGINFEAPEKTVKLTLVNSMIAGSPEAGLALRGMAELTPESTGNVFRSNGWPITSAANALGTIPAGNIIGGNDSSWILVTSEDLTVVTRSATWRNHGVPYRFQASIGIGGPANPVVTVEPGTELVFTASTGLTVGYDGPGSLVAVGAGGKPIKFTSETQRAGGWEGLHFSDEAGAGNRLERVTIEYANIGISISADLGGFIKNTTIRNSAEMGIYRGYGTEGTTFLTGLGNQFEGNALDENQE
ncbi:MAG: copper amine oxidase N-terminal domain-containing protein [Bacillota bacterium]